LVAWWVSSGTTPAQGQRPVKPVQVQQMPVSSASLTITLPALSVSTIEIQ
jgi:hypothetical protein